MEATVTETQSFPKKDGREIHSNGSTTYFLMETTVTETQSFPKKDGREIHSNGSTESFPKEATVTEIRLVLSKKRGPNRNSQ